MDLILNNLQWLMCHETKPNQTLEIGWFVLIYKRYRAIGLISKVFANGPGDRRSIPGRIIPKT